MPGLILAAEDKSGAHKYEAIGIRIKPAPIFRSSTNAEAQKVGRKEYREMEADGKLNGMKARWAAYEEDPENTRKPIFKHFPYIPYELE